MCHEGHEGHKGQHVVYFLNAAGSRISKSNMTIPCVMKVMKATFTFTFTFTFTIKIYKVTERTVILLNAIFLKMLN